MRLFRSIYPSLAWLGLIWTMSSLPSSNIPSFKIVGFDKLAHICVYFILGILINSWLRARKFTRSQVFFFYCILIFLASADEFHQTYIPGRSVTVYDQMANLIGLGLASLLLLKKQSR